MVKLVCMGGVVMLFAACNTPAPQPWLRFKPTGQHNWAAGSDGLWVTRLHGADVQLDLNRTQTRVQVTVTNSSVAPVEVRMGPEAASPKDAIGEYLVRALDGQAGIGGPDMQPYATMQRVSVQNGWRSTFYLDSPLGSEPVLGTYFVFTIEGRNAAGDVERRSMPLLATNAGMMPLDGR
jgi:hypothetical protein